MPDLTNEQKTNMRRLVAALRSGEYKQGKKVLRDTEDCYCCLGVAIDLVSPQDWGCTTLNNHKTCYKAMRGGKDSGKYVDTFYTNCYETVYAPKEVCEKYGLEFNTASKYDLDTQGCYASMNDEGKSFAEIADALERHFLPEDVKHAPQEA